jgi:Spy/CpxP family protein refolding chaperone
MNTLTRIGLGISAVAVTVGLAAGVHVSAQNSDEARGPFPERRGGPGGFRGPGGPMGALGPVLAHLGLTDAQKDQLKGIMDSHRGESKGLGDRAMTARQALQSAVTADVLDEGLIRARAADLATVESDLAVAHARIHADVFRILTPEQQAQAREAQTQMQQHMSRRGGVRSQRPPQ